MLDSSGSWPWFQEVLDTLDPVHDTVFFVSHQPFRCREGVPDWYFCFDKSRKEAFRQGEG